MIEAFYPYFEALVRSQALDSCTISRKRSYREIAAFSRDSCAFSLRTRSHAMLDISSVRRSWPHHRRSYHCSAYPHRSLSACDENLHVHCRRNASSLAQSSHKNSIGTYVNSDKKREMTTSLLFLLDSQPFLIEPSSRSCTDVENGLELSKRS